MCRARGLDPAIKLSSSATSGDLGLTWQATDSASVLIKASRGFRSPNIFDVANLGERPGNRFSIPNPELGPETVDAFELGVRWRKERLRAEFFAFESRYNNRITSVLTGELDAQGRSIVQSRNAAEAIKAWSFSRSGRAVRLSRWNLSAAGFAVMNACRASSACRQIAFRH